MHLNYPFPSSLIYEHIDTVELNALKPKDLERLHFILSLGIIGLAYDTKMKAELFDIFKSSPLTLASLNLIVNGQG